MARVVQTITTEFLTPELRPEIRYHGLYQSRSRPDLRRVRRVMLISPPAVLFRGDLPRCTYPLGLGYLAATLEANGYEVKVLDCLVEGYYDCDPVAGDPDFLRYGLSAAAVAKELQEWQPEVIGVSSIFSNQSDVIEEVLAVAQQICPNALRVTGGAHARYFPMHYLDELKLDAVFLGEAENTLVEYLDWVNGARSLKSLEGVMVRSDCRDSEPIYQDNSMPLILSRGRKRGDELDVIPFPAWHHFNMERYFEIGAYQSPYTVGSRVGQIYTSRGCTAKCTFCTTTNFWGGKLRRRSADNVLAELNALIKYYGIDEFHIQDDNITNDREHARFLFGELSRLKLPWCTPQGTALWRMDEDMLERMRDSGCYQVTFAIESGVQRVLDQLIRKPLDLGRTSHLVQFARDIGLDVHGFFIVGMPPMFGFLGESVEEMHQTFKYARDTGFNSASFFTATPIVGSVLLNECLERGYLSGDTPLHRMSYKQGLIDVPGLWRGRDIAALAHDFNTQFNGDVLRRATRKWTKEQY